MSFAAPLSPDAFRMEFGNLLFTVDVGIIPHQVIGLGGIGLMPQPKILYYSPPAPGEVIDSNFTPQYRPFVQFEALPGSGSPIRTRFILGVEPHVAIQSSLVQRYKGAVGTAAPRPSFFTSYLAVESSVQEAYLSHASSEGRDVAAVPRLAYRARELGLHDEHVFEQLEPFRRGLEMLLGDALETRDAASDLIATSAEASRREGRFTLAAMMLELSAMCFTLPATMDWRDLGESPCQTPSDDFGARFQRERMLMAAYMWQMSLDEYGDPDSYIIRLFQGVMNACYAGYPTRFAELMRLSLEFNRSRGMQADAAEDLMRLAWLQAHRARQCRVIWRDVSANIDGAVSIWDGLGTMQRYKEAAKGLSAAALKLAN
jgi:hypothetical protein